MATSADGTLPAYMDNTKGAEMFAPETGAGRQVPGGEEDGGPQAAAGEEATLAADAEVASVLAGDGDDGDGTTTGKRGAALFNSKIIELTSHWGASYDDDANDDSAVGFVNFSTGDREHRKKALAMVKNALESDASRAVTPQVSDRDLEDTLGQRAYSQVQVGMSERTQDCCTRLVKLQMRRQMIGDAKRR